MPVMHLCAIALHFEFAYNVTRIRNCGDRLYKFHAVYLNNCAILLLISSKDFNELYALRRPLNRYFKQSQQNIRNRVLF